MGEGFVELVHPQHGHLVVGPGVSTPGDGHLVAQRAGVLGQISVFADVVSGIALGGLQSELSGISGGDRGCPAPSPGRARKTYRDPCSCSLNLHLVHKPATFGWARTVVTGRFAVRCPEPPSRISRQFRLIEIATMGP